jgi:hypothetical protein
MISQKIDKFLAWTKWPFAILALVFGLALVKTLLSGSWALSQLLDNLPFWAGIGGYYLAWTYIFKKPVWGSWFSTFEHELTHVLFAWATFHRAKISKVTHGDGGYMTHQGMGNWLIMLSPYFFPTFSFLLILMHVFFDVAEFAYQAALGASVCYHAISTYHATHKGQTDLQESGLAFSWCVLPGLNLYFYLLILATLRIGFDSISKFHATLFYKVGDIISL